jgi:hypothetical protein
VSRPNAAVARRRRTARLLRTGMRMRRNIAAIIDAADTREQVTYIVRRGRRVAVIGPLSLIPPPAQSLAGELERLLALKERGALTDAEFEQAKRRVLTES